MLCGCVRVKVYVVCNTDHILSAQKLILHAHKLSFVEKMFISQRI